MNLSIKVKPLPNKMRPRINTLRVTVKTTKKAFVPDAIDKCSALQETLKKEWKGKDDYRIRCSAMRNFKEPEDDICSFNVTYPSDQLEETKVAIYKESAKLGIEDL
jgi:hypothetical protein